MPNHCYNRLTFFAPQEMLEDIKADLSHIELSFDDDNKPITEYHHLSFNNIIPQPADLNTDCSKDSRPLWYTWRIDNWGTKWEPWDVDVDLSGKMLTYSFITAWADPKQIVEALSKRYKTALHHSYTEEFGQFSGIRMYVDGEEIVEQYCEFDIPTAAAMMDANFAFDHLRISVSNCPSCGREKTLDHYSNTQNTEVCEDCCDVCPKPE